jgi:FKBP-type peptidyl-prolyl cis-trans isomerase
MACIVALATPFAAVIAQDGAAVPGIKPAVVATEMSEEDLIKKASIVLVYNQLGRMLVQLKSDGIELDQEQALEGARRAIAGEPLGVSLDEARAVMMQLQKQAQATQAKRQKEMMAKMKELAATNKAEGEAYLAKNATKEGVQTLEGGVQYEVMVAGTGPKPKPTDKVKINYHGTFIDGKVFDSTIDPPQGKKAEPIINSASGFVEGFNAAVQAMPVGSKWKISIPGEQGYGASGRGPIGPNQTIVFEVEMLEILPPVVAPDDVTPAAGQ